MFIRKGTKLYSIVHRKCPFCHEGEFFVSRPYDLRHAGELHKRCPACQRKFEKEPGFYWGALFVSYAQTIAFSLIVLGIAYVVWPDLDLGAYAAIVIGATIIAAPYLYALSKILWANMFFHYQGANARGTSVTRT